MHHLLIHSDVDSVRYKVLKKGRVCSNIKKAIHFVARPGQTLILQLAGSNC